MFLDRLFHGGKVIYVLVMKRGRQPDNPSYYIDQILKSLVPEALTSPGTKIKSTWNCGYVDRENAVAAAFQAFGRDVSNPNYNVFTEKFSDADGDGGIVLSVQRK